MIFEWYLKEVEVILGSPANHPISPYSIIFGQHFSTELLNSHLNKIRSASPLNLKKVLRFIMALRVLTSNIFSI